jgi:hypothetical protein
MAETCKSEVLLTAVKSVTPDELQLFVCIFRFLLASFRGLAYLRKTSIRSVSSL